MGTNGAQEKCIQGFGGRNLRARDNFEGVGVDGRIILKWLLKKYDVGVEYIDVAEDGEKWWALVSMVMNLQIL